MGILASRQKKMRLGSMYKKELDRRLKSIKTCIPMEFQRKIGQIKHANRWKATVMRFFLLGEGGGILRSG